MNKILCKTTLCVCLAVQLQRNSIFQRQTRQRGAVQDCGNHTPRGARQAPRNLKSLLQVSELAVMPIGDFVP